MDLAEGQHTMALDQPALLEVLDALKAAEVDDRIRQAAETICPALIEAELSSVIGALPHERTSSRAGWRNGHRPRTITTAAGIRSCGSRSCGRGRSSRRCWSGAGGALADAPALEVPRCDRPPDVARGRGPAWRPHSLVRGGSRPLRVVAAPSAGLKRVTACAGSAPCSGIDQRLTCGPRQVRC
jgi:hypothetical protein